MNSKIIKGKILGSLISLFLFPLAKSWRLKYFYISGEEINSVKKATDLPTTPCMAILHGHQLPCIAFNPYKDLAAMASRSKDGEIAATVLDLWHIKPLRGSSHKGGREALQAAIEHINEGGKAVFTVDGPRGPRGCCKKGIVEMALATKNKIQPITCQASRVWQLHSWDRFIIPKPFSKIVVIYGETIDPGENSDSEALFAVCEQVSRSLAHLEELASEKCK